MDRNDDRAIDEAEFIKFFSSGKAAAAAFKLGAKQRGRAEIRHWQTIRAHVALATHASWLHFRTGRWPLSALPGAEASGAETA